MTTTLIERLYRSVGLSARTEVREAASLIWSERPLIIVGPAGLDHEAIAREAHASSSRRRCPFVVVDTNQAQARRTLARAAGGTVYVDLTEVDLDGRFASALVGWDGSSVDVRPIFASHDLESLRAGLGALADGPCVRLRPLSERSGDVPDLLASLLGEAGHKASLAALSAARRRGLTRARWRRNLDSLREAVPRLGAFLGTGSLRGAAESLGVSHQSLGEALARMFNERG